VYMHLMPFFCQAIPNHLRQFFGCYLGFLHGSVPVFPTNYWASESLQTPPLLFPYFIGYLSAAPFVAAPAFFLQPESFVRKCGASVTPRKQISRRRCGSDLPKAHSQGPCYCHHMNRTVDVILGLTAAVATALLLALIARDDIGMPPDMVREDALIGASIMIAAVAGISSRKVRQ